LFIEENSQFKERNHKVSFSFFLFIVIIISLLVIGYICSNIMLMKLGYQSIDLEQKSEQLLVRKDLLVYSVEQLSSLTRIEQIACQELGMHRPENIEFIVMLPADINMNLVVSQPPEERNGAGYLEAGAFLKEFANLQIIKNQ
jgi:cell division protein FtsL